MVFDGTQATGVEVRIGWSSCKLVKASKGVVLSAGAVFTPQLLQVSGVGPSDVLQDLGVDTVSELSGVGANFVDRSIVSGGFISPQNLALSIGSTVYINPKSDLLEGVGGGDISSQLSITSLALVSPEKRTEGLRLAVAALMAILKKKNLIQYIDRMINPVALDPTTLSRGWVKATSKEVLDPPDVTANFFANPEDMRSQIERFQILLNMTKTPALDSYTITNIPLPDAIAQEINKTAPLIWEAMSCLFRERSQTLSERIFVPCPQPVEWTNQGMEEYLRKYLISSYHYFGSSAAGSVVNGEDFSVIGTENLYVADAGVFPMPTHVNPQGSIMALGHYVGRLLAQKKR